jgi:hypothetical protein
MSIEQLPQPPRRPLTIICSSCGQPWIDQHQCPMPPPIDWSRYTTSALESLASHLDLVIKGRRKYEPSPSGPEEGRH